MRLRLHRNDRAIEGREVQMRFPGIVQDHTPQFDPGVGFKTARVLSSTNAQISWDTAPAEKPPEHQRLLKATGVENEMPRDCILDACDVARSFDLRGGGRRRWLGPARSEPHEQGLPGRKPRQPQAYARGRQRRCRLQRDTARPCAQTPESTPCFHCFFQPTTSKKVAQAGRDASQGWRGRAVGKPHGSARKWCPKVLAGRSAPDLYQTLAPHFLQKLDQVSFATLRIHVVFIKQGVPQLADGPLLLQ